MRLVIIDATSGIGIALLMFFTEKTYANQQAALSLERLEESKDFSVLKTNQEHPWLTAPVISFGILPEEVFLNDIVSPEKGLRENTDYERQKGTVNTTPFNGEVFRPPPKIKRPELRGSFFISQF